MSLFRTVWPEKNYSRFVKTRLCTTNPKISVTTRTLGTSTGAIIQRLGRAQTASEGRYRPNRK